jgi:TolA-binding protein
MTVSKLIAEVTSTLSIPTSFVAPMSKEEELSDEIRILRYRMDSADESGKADLRRQIAKLKDRLSQMREKRKISHGSA